MITLYGFKRIFAGGVGETKDLRVQWALEETGLPYQVHALDQPAGDLESEAYSRLSPFHQVPVIEDEGFVVAESAAVLVYLAEKAGKLIPADVQGRARVIQWCFAAVSTIAPTLSALDLFDVFESGKAAHALQADVRQLADRWLRDLERHLAEREWIASADFTVADILMASVLRGVRKTDLMAPYPRIKGFFARAHARPAWHRALELYADRFGVAVDELR